MESRKAIYNKEFLLGGGICVLYLTWAFLWVIYSVLIKGSFKSPYLPFMNMRTELLSPFQSGYILGTDVFGRSLFEVLSAGLVYSISISIIVSLLSCCIGLLMGYFAVNGFKYLKIICDFLTNFIFILPSLLLAILLMSFSGQSFTGLIFVLIFTGWPAYAKLARGETKRILGLCYLEGARAVGASKLRVLFKVMIPEMLPIFMVHIILSLSGVIISEATLGFLGLGGSEYSWGVLLSMGKGVLLEAPFIVIITSLALGLLVIGLNLLGDGFRDYLDPKS